MFVLLCIWNNKEVGKLNRGRCMVGVVLKDVKRKFSSVLDIGSGSGHFSKLLEQDQTSKVTMLDMSGTQAPLSPAREYCPDMLSEKMLHRDPDSEFEGSSRRLLTQLRAGSL